MGSRLLYSSRRLVSVRNNGNRVRALSNSGRSDRRPLSTAAKLAMPVAGVEICAMAAPRLQSQAHSFLVDRSIRVRRPQNSHCGSPTGQSVLKPPLRDCGCNNKHPISRLRWPYDIRHESVSVIQSLGSASIRSGCRPRGSPLSSELCDCLQRRTFTIAIIGPGL